MGANPKAQEALSRPEETLLNEIPAVIIIGYDVVLPSWTVTLV